MGKDGHGAGRRVCATLIAPWANDSESIYLHKRIGVYGTRWFVQQFNVVLATYASALCAAPIDLPLGPPDGVLETFKGRPQASRARH